MATFVPSCYGELVILRDDDESKTEMELIDDQDEPSGIEYSGDNGGSENTRKSIKYALSVFDDFCLQSGTRYDTLDGAGLDSLLARFYAGARNKKGELYTKKSMLLIRFGLQRHFLATRGVDIVKNASFTQAYVAFKTMLIQLKVQGKERKFKSRHIVPVCETDLSRIQSSLDVNTALGLLQKVFVDMQVYFGKTMGDLGNLNPGDFVLHPGRGDHPESVSLMKETWKQYQPVDQEEEREMHSQMFAMPGNPLCPVANLKKYLGKLDPTCKKMWQRPRQRIPSDNDSPWYDMAIGRNSLTDMTKKISIEARCSQLYSNRCLQETSRALLNSVLQTLGASSQGKSHDSVLLGRGGPEQNSLPSATQSQMSRFTIANAKGPGNFPSGHGAADTSMQTRAEVTVRRPEREPEQPDWSVVDVSVDDELGWEMEDEEESWVESYQNPQVARSYSQAHAGPSGHASAVATRAPQPSTRGIGQEMPLNPKRRRTEPTFQASPSIDRSHPLPSNQSHEADPVVVVVTPARNQTQHSARSFGKSQVRRSDQVEVLPVEDLPRTGPNSPKDWENGGVEPRTAIQANAVDGIHRKVTREDARGSPSKLYHRASGVASPILSDGVPSTPVSSEDQDILGYCFTCQDPLLVEDVEKRSLLATQNNMKLLHALRQMCWPGLYNPHCNFRTLTCCGGCVQLIREYIETMKTLSALKGSWLQRTGHNSAPHLNQFSQEVFATRDSIIDSPSRNVASARVEMMDQHVQVSSPHRVQHSPVNHPQRVSDFIPIREPQQASPLCRVSSPRPDSGICAPGEPPGVHEHVDPGDRHQVSDHPQVSASLALENERGRTHMESQGVDSADEGGTPGQRTLQETPRRGPLTRPPSKATDDAQLRVTGRSVAGKHGVSSRVHQEPDGGTGDPPPDHPDAAGVRKISERTGDSLPPSAASTPQDHHTDTGQDGGMPMEDHTRQRADHNFDSRPGDFAVTIKQEAEEFYDEPPGGSGLPMETHIPDNRTRMLRKSRAEVQKAYRERKKLSDPSFLRRESKRVAQYRVPTASLAKYKLPK